MSIFNFSSQNINNTQPISSPFWSINSSVKTPKKQVKEIFKIIWKVIKIAFFIFMMLMGLWGCFQSSFDKTVSQNTAIGAGMEFGFPYGTTGDFYYDLQKSPSAVQYSTFSEWTIAYGPFYALFVWPVANIVHNLMFLTRHLWGGTHALLAIFLLLIVIRGLTLIISLQSTFQSEKMMEVQGKINEINNKYAGVKDPNAKRMQQQELVALYKKHNIKPFAAFQQMFLTMPIFLIIYRVVTILRPMKAISLFNIWAFSETPLTRVFAGDWVYIFFLILVAVAQVMSMKIPQFLANSRNKKQNVHSSVSLGQQNNTASQNKPKLMNKTKIMQNVFVVAMCVIVAFSPCGVGLYWFLNSFFSVGQSYLIHKLIIKRRKQEHDKKAQQINFKLE